MPWNGRGIGQHPRAQVLNRLTPEEREEFRQYSRESYRIIEEHDSMLESWASMGRRARPRRQQRARRCSRASGQRGSGCRR